MSRILIIGNGVVGNATGRVLKVLGHAVEYYDIKSEKSTIEKFDIHEFNGKQMYSMAKNSEKSV